MLARGTINQGGIPARQAGPGDILASGEVLGALATVGAGTWTGALIAGGIIRRTGPVGGYTDTTDTAQNILTSLGGNDFAANVLPGTSFRFMFLNTVAQAMTFAAGRGVVAGLGVLNGTASLVREYLLRVLNSSPEVTTTVGTTNASAIVTLDTPLAAGTITPGMLVTAANVTAGTKVAGVTYGRTSTRDNTDKICSITLDANATGTVASGTSAIFSPVVEINGLREGTL